MHLFNDHDLYKLISDEEVFSIFSLTDKQRHVVRLRVLRGLSFKLIGEQMQVTSQAAHHLYAKSLKKMRKQIIGILKSYKPTRPEISTYQPPAIAKE